MTFFNSFNPFRSYSNAHLQVNNEPYVSRSSAVSDTIVAIAVSALSLVGASAFQREAPGFSAILLAVPALTFVVWLMRRFNSPANLYEGRQGSSVHVIHSAPVISHEPMHALPVHRGVYVPPPVVGQVTQAQTTYSNPPGLWSRATNFFMGGTRPSFPQVAPVNPNGNGMHALPQNRSFPNVQPAPVYPHSQPPRSVSRENLIPLAQHRQ